MMEAGFCYCDYETFSFYDARNVKARKEHTCCECGETIKPGDTYERAATVLHGVFRCYKTCLLCCLIRRDYCAAYTMLRETIWEGLGIDYMGEWEDDDD